MSYGAFNTILCLIHTGMKTSMSETLKVKLYEVSENS